MPPEQSIPIAGQTRVAPERVIVLRLSGFDDPPAQSVPEPVHESAPDFAPVFARLTNVVPEIEVLRPGLVVMRARGPARYYGGEAEAAEALMSAAREAGVVETRAGIADGRFTAIIAATIGTNTNTNTNTCIVPPGTSAEFLRELPVSHLSDDRLAQVLPGLGIYTLGAFAALPEDAVRARFGPSGVRAHRHSRGVDPELYETVRPDLPERDFEVGLDFEPPLSGAEQLAFACSALTERLSAALTEVGVVCTTLRITLTDDTGAKHEREWAHPRFFTPADMLARLRWQAGAFEPGSTLGTAPHGTSATAPHGTSATAPHGTSGTAPRSSVSTGTAHLSTAHLSTERTGAGIESVRLFPVRTDRATTHEPGLWATGVDDRVHHHISRAQSLLGPAGVGTAALDGGRLLRDRQRFTPWGVAPEASRGPGPWPGALPVPAPSLVFAPPLRALLCDETGAPVSVDSDDLLSAAPATLRVEQHEALGRVRGWSRPWPIREHWWEGRPSRYRLQLELDSGDAWVLLAQQNGMPAPTTGHTPPPLPIRWFAEGRYD